MKKSELVFNVLLVPLDFVAIFLATLVAYSLRFNTGVFTRVFPVGLSVDFHDYLILSLVASALFLLFLALNGLYVLKNTRRIYGEIFKVFGSISSATLAIIIVIFFTQQGDTSRFLVLAVWVFAIIFVSLIRLFLRIFQRIMFRRGKFTRKIVLIGNNATTKTLAETYKKYPSMGYKVVADLPEDDIEHTLQRLMHIKNTEQLDEIVQANSHFTSDQVERLVDFSYEYHVDFKYTPDIFESHATNIAIRTVAGIPVIELKKTPLEGWGRVIKRIIDIIGATFGIILTSPLLIFTALAVRLDSEGPVIYKNVRINHHGKKFNVFKFRSYKKEFCVGEGYGGKKADEFENKLIETQSARKGPLYKIDRDPRITRVGHFIRKTSLDELPQLFNVLKGDLSLVGPRPHVPKEVAKYEKHHKRVLTIKPGVTGLPQINGRSDLDFEEEVRLDVYYIENWSLLLDIKILLMTPLTLLRSRKTV